MHKEKEIIDLFDHLTSENQINEDEDTFIWYRMFDFRTHLWSSS